MAYIKQNIRTTKPRTKGQRARSQARPVQKQTREALPLNPPVSILKVLFPLVGICSAFILLIWLQIQIDETSKVITDIEQSIKDQISKNQYAAQELDRASSYEFIYQSAQTRFGMDLPKGSKVFLYVPDEILSLKGQQ